jgi:hypothetical protein
MSNGSVSQSNNLNQMKMKFNNYIKVFTLLTGGLLLASCGDEKSYFPNYTVAPGGANIKFIHSAPDVPGANLFLNEGKVTSGATINSGVAFAAAFPVSYYSLVTPGSLGIKVVVPATTTTSEVLVTSGNIDVQEGQFYTIALSGIAPNYSTTLLNDDISSISYNGKSVVRFINLIHNSTNKLSVVAKLTTNGNTTTTNVAQGVAYKEATAFVELEPGDYTIELRDATTNALVAAVSTANKVLAGNRVYTFFARGLIGSASPAAKVPTLERATLR